MCDSEEYRSELSLNLFHPILHLIKHLDELKPAPPSPVKTNVFENSYSCAVVVLSVIAFESAIRGYYAMKGSSKQTSAPKLFSQLTKDKKNGKTLAEHVNEIFVIRDVIVHNYIWKGKVRNDNVEGLVWEEGPKMANGFGRKRYEEAVADESNQTKNLGLNVIPTKIWRQDAYIVLQTVCEALVFMEQFPGGNIGFSSHHFKFRGQNLLIQDIASSLIKKMPVKS